MNDPISPKKATKEMSEESANATPAPSEPATASETASPAASSIADRKARFAALRARNTDSRKANLAETKSEHSRLTTNTSVLAALDRKRTTAEHKLLKADTEAAGEDFERKRAWDWTAEESEKWDKRMNKKQRHRDDAAFADYNNEANKHYKRQVRDTNVDHEAYEAEKARLIERAAQGGDMEIVETANGELIAVDREGKFYSTADSTDFVSNKPSKDAIDRLVGDLKKAEEARMKAYRKRRGKESDEDVTYINEKNKQFNQKLARFYDSYTKEIRDSFERGTAL